MNNRKTFLLLACGGTLATLLGLCLGPDGFSWPSSFALRGPRVGLALVVGAGLSATGAALQGLLRNALADPYIVGVAGGAAVGGSVVVAAGITAPLALEGGAFAAALLATFLLAFFVQRDREGGERTLLAGVVFNAFCAAVITLVKTLLPPQKAYQLLYWLVGTIDYIAPIHLLLLGIVIGGALLSLLYRAGHLELLSLGHDEAKRLGVDAGRVRVEVYIATSLVVAAIVPTTGMIGFVGLIVPHALRLMQLGDMRSLLPASILVGGPVLVLFDGLSRLSFEFVGSEVPTGALTAIVGAPVFGWLLLRSLGDR